eukprot:1161931-Pelagomonas_calceolata.AAC.2
MVGRVIKCDDTFISLDYEVWKARQSSSFSTSKAKPWKSNSKVAAYIDASNFGLGHQLCLPSSVFSCVPSTCVFAPSLCGAAFCRPYMPVFLFMWSLVCPQCKVRLSVCSRLSNELEENHRCQANIVWFYFGCIVRWLGNGVLQQSPTTLPG